MNVDLSGLKRRYRESVEHLDASKRVNSPAIQDEALEVFHRCKRELETALKQLGYPAVVEKSSRTAAEYQQLANQTGLRHRVELDGVDTVYVPSGAPDAE